MVASGWSTFANFVSSKEFLKNNSYGVGLCLEILLIKKIHRSSPSEVFLAKGILKIYSKFTGEHPCRNNVIITKSLIIISHKLCVQIKCCCC